MHDYFFELAERLDKLVRGREVYTAWFEGEDSSFVRFNRGRLRQPGQVRSRGLSLDLIEGKRHAAGRVTLSGELQIDLDRSADLVRRLRGKLPSLRHDPYLMYNDAVESSEANAHNSLMSPADAAGEIIDAARGADLVGIYAAGGIHRGFANSLGQRNWFSKYNFNLDWSLYARGDKAAKSSYAGFDWNGETLSRKMEQSREQLAVLERPAKTIEPGRYRVYLSPSALWELFWLLGWDAFGLKSFRTKQTPLIKMAEEDERLDPRVSVTENTAGGAGPAFQAAGYAKPDRVDLIVAGRLSDCLKSPRSAKEYGERTNGASEAESPESLDMAPGSLDADDVVRSLGTGIYVSNVWYLNYSDRAACRVTGMTRFATFWVERGEIRAPLNVMRFDDSLYRMLGTRLEGLTKQREFVLDADTYERRSTASTRLPGALVESLALTL